MNHDPFDSDELLLSLMASVVHPSTSSPPDDTEFSPHDLLVIFSDGPAYVTGDTSIDVRTNELLLAAAWEMLQDGVDPHQVLIETVIFI